MIRFVDVLAVAAALIGLGVAGANLGKIERVMRELAVESYRDGYIGVSQFQGQLDRGR